MKAFLVTAALAIAGLGWAGAAGTAGAQRIGFLGGATTLGGALIICLLFMLQTRWLGLGGAAVVGLAGAGRNVPAVIAVISGAAGAPEWCRLGIALVCGAVFVVAGRVLLEERRNG